MNIGVLKESIAGETRVALVPESVKKLIAKGYKVFIEKDAGLKASFLNEKYVEAGAEIVDDYKVLMKQSEILCKVRHFENNSQRQELEQLNNQSILFGIQDPINQKSAATAFQNKKLNVFSMEFVPRITLAQSMDVLSSMATVAGYKAVLLATEHFGKFFPMFMTAAGTIPPAKVLILGAGVAGLQAIATARRLGAVVEVFDVRPAAREQVESLGGKFIEMELDESNQDASGYAKEMSPEFIKKEMELIQKHLSKSDICICTAQIFGKKAPILIKDYMIPHMHPGSVIIDLAAEQGGNCELSKAGEVVTVNDVKIVGPVNLASSLPIHASQMYSKNLENLITYLSKEKGVLSMDPNDDIVKGAMIYRDGELVSEFLKKLLQ